METQTIRKGFSRIGLALAIFLIIPPFVRYGIYYLLGLVAPGLLQLNWFNTMMPYLTMYLISFPLALLVLRTAPESPACPPPLKRLSILQILGLVSIGFSMMHLLRRFSDMVAALITRAGTNVAAESTVVDSAVPQSNPTETLLITLISFVVAVFAAPIIEEVLFRGVLYKKLAAYGGRIFVFFSALFFGLGHRNIYQLFYAFAMGLLLGAVVWLTGTIRYSIIIHVLANFLGGGVQILLQTFGNESALAIWDTIVNILIPVGVIVGLVWLFVRRRSVHLPPRAVGLPAKPSWVLSPGMIIYWLAAAYGVVTSLFAG